MSVKSLIAKQRLVLDGALGTQLEELIPPSSPMYVKGSPLWSTEVLLGDPSVVQQVHSSYIQKGADMIITSSYQASQATLEKHRNMDLEQVRATWDAAVQTAKKAVESSKSERKVYIASSVGPYGAYLANGAEYSGEYGDKTVEDLKEYHRNQVLFFLESKDTDVIAFETIPSFNEVKAIFELIKECYTQTAKEFYICFSCKDSTTLADGTDLKEVIEYVVQQKDDNSIISDNLVAVGCNCVDFELVSNFANYVNTASKNTLDLAVYPNLGFSNDMSDVSQYGFKSDTQKWREALQEWCTIPTIRLLGGCCSTGSNEIAITRQVVDESA